MTEKEYKPNHIPVRERVANIFYGTGLLAYGAYGLFKGELFFPGRRGREDTIFTDTALYIIAFAMLLGAINMYITVLDHYDKRNNEHDYKFASRVLMVVGISCVFIAVIIK